QGYADDNGDGFCALNENGVFLTLSTLAEANKYISNSDLTKFFRNQDEVPSSTNYAFNAGNTTVRLSRPGFYYENLTNKITSLKADFTDQITENHQLRAGAQGRLHTYDMVRRSSYLGAVDPKQQFYNEIWKIKPKELGLYVQDRMEYAGLIINLGLRLDTWNPDAKDFTNYFAPYQSIKVPYDTLSGVPIQVDGRVTQRERKVDTYVFFSPRLGVSHPISDNAAMYFSYARTQIPPPYSRLYAFYNNFGNLSLPNVPTIRQEPYRSSNYELGVQWQFAERFGLNFSAYLRDIENYGLYSFTVIPRSSSYGTTYGITTSAGYADSRGVEMSLRAQPQKLFDFVTLVGQLNYAYSYIKASSFAGLDKSMQTSFSTAN
ncbi:MAG: TonB-dependent receptor, partial [Bacteroidota bacterium]